MLNYVIVEEDFLPNVKFPSQYILQLNYNAANKEKITEKFNRQVIKYRNMFRSKQITIEEVNTNMYAVVDSLKEQFPDDFPDENTLGWFSKNLLASLYLQGHVTLTGYTYLQLKIKEKEAKIQIAENIAKEKVDKQNIKETNRINVHIGMLFKTKYCVELAYKDLMPTKIKKKHIQEFLNNYLTVEYVKVANINGKVWQVTEVKQEGGRAWT